MPPNHTHGTGLGEHKVLPIFSRCLLYPLNPTGLPLPQEMLHFYMAVKSDSCHSTWHFGSSVTAVWGFACWCLTVQLLSCHRAWHHDQSHRVAIGEAHLNEFWICIVVPWGILKSLWLSLVLQPASQKSATEIEHEAKETTLLQTKRI